MNSVPHLQADAVTTTARVHWSVRTRTLIEAAVLFSLCTLLFAFVQFGTSALADNDGYYHMKMGLLIREQGLSPPFVWLPNTILGPDAFYDHHMLYHVYLSLFTGDGQEQTMIAGAKLASILMPSLAFM